MDAVHLRFRPPRVNLRKRSTAYDSIQYEWHAFDPLHKTSYHVFQLVCPEVSIYRGRWNSTNQENFVKVISVPRRIVHFNHCESCSWIRWYVNESTLHGIGIHLKLQPRRLGWRDPRIYGQLLCASARQCKRSQHGASQQYSDEYYLEMPWQEELRCCCCCCTPCWSVRRSIFVGRIGKNLNQRSKRPDQNLAF